MHLIYVDESGNTGARLDDPQQPMHFLVAVLVSEHVWLYGYEYWRNQVLSATRDFAAAAGIPLPAELHATDVYNGTRMFRGVDRSARSQIACSVLKMLRRFELAVVYAVCDKRPLASEHPGDLSVQAERVRLLPGLVESNIYPVDEGKEYKYAEYEKDPGAIAWGLLLRGCESYLTQLEPQSVNVPLGDNVQHGIIIADRGRLQGLARRNIRASMLVSRTEHPPESLDEVEEMQNFCRLLDTVHFVDSRESPYIQLADFVAYFIMRAWRAGHWERPGAERYYDEFVRPVVRKAYRYPAKESDG